MIQRGELGDVEALQRPRPRNERGEQQRLDEPVVDAERMLRRQRIRLGVRDRVRREQQLAEVVAVELARVVEVALEVIAERLVPRREDVEEVADADEVSNRELVAAIDEQLQHHA